LSDRFAALRKLILEAITQTRLKEATISSKWLALRVDKIMGARLVKVNGFYVETTND
jgi:hypothetical protein